MKRIAALLAISFAIVYCNPNKRSAGQQETAETDDSRATTVQLQKIWSSPPELTTCESTLYDKERDVVFVSNIDGGPTEKDGNGFISRLGTDGSILQLRWVEGLHAPKGMAIYNNILYVTDIDELVEIDIEGATVVRKHAVEGASFLNDVAVDDNGSVYFTDSDTGLIHVLRNGQVSTWKSDPSFERPNGLFHQGDALLLALSGSGQLLSVDYGTGAIKTIASGIGRGDGIAPDGRENLFVSNWEGQVFFVVPGESPQLILDTREQEKNTADIDFIVEKNLLLVPTFFGNMVEAYTVEYVN